RVGGDGAGFCFEPCMEQLGDGHLCRVNEGATFLLGEGVAFGFLRLFLGAIGANGDVPPLAGGGVDGGHPYTVAGLRFIRDRLPGGVFQRLAVRVFLGEVALNHCHDGEIPFLRTPPNVYQMCTEWAARGDKVRRFLPPVYHQITDISLILWGYSGVFAEWQ